MARDVYGLVHPEATTIITGPQTRSCSILDLPAEMFLQIFHTAVAMSQYSVIGHLIEGCPIPRVDARGEDVAPPTTNQPRGTSILLLSLSHVCSRWRALCLGDPSLWSTIHLEPVSSARPVGKLLPLLVARSKGEIFPPSTGPTAIGTELQTEHPLQIILHFHLNPQVSQFNQLSIIPILVELAPRISLLSLSFHVLTFTNWGVLLQSSRLFPRLKYLSLRVVPDPDHPDVTPRVSCPNLATICLHEFTSPVAEEALKDIIGSDGGVRTVPNIAVEVNVDDDLDYEPTFRRFGRLFRVLCQDFGPIVKMDLRSGGWVWVWNAQSHMRGVAFCMPSVSADWRTPLSSLQPTEPSTKAIQHIHPMFVQRHSLQSELRELSTDIDAFGGDIAQVVGLDFVSVAAFTIRIAFAGPARVRATLATFTKFWGRIQMPKVCCLRLQWPFRVHHGRPGTVSAQEIVHFLQCFEFGPSLTWIELVNFKGNSDAEPWVREFSRLVEHESLGMVEIVEDVGHIVD